MDETTRKVLMSSVTETWETPWETIDMVINSILPRYGIEISAFSLDVCAASADVAKGARFFTPEQDALIQRWSGHCWMNPPYGRGIRRWIQQARDQVRAGHAASVTCLLPARTDTRYFHDECFEAATVLLPGRIRFMTDNIQCRDAAPFPSMICCFGVPVEHQGTIVRIKLPTITV